MLQSVEQEIKLLKSKMKKGNGRRLVRKYKGVITRNFTQLFTASNVDGDLSPWEKLRQVSEENNVELVADVTAEEVKETVFSMHLDKSPDQVV